MSVVIAGCGYVGSALAGRLGARAFGIRRSPLEAGVRGIAADLRDRKALVGSLPADTTALVYAAAPGSGDDPAYRAAYVDGLRTVLAALAEIGAPLRRAIVTTSTAVYPEDAGWVDEASDTAPEGRAPILLEAEAIVRGSVAEGIALRLAGIYGPGRDRIVRSVADGTARTPREPRYGNRIHRDDAASALAHLVALDRSAPIYVGVDDDPADLREVYAWVASQLGVAPPPPEDDTARAPRGTHKRCRNARLRATGWSPSYPSYREGYAEAITRARRT